MIFEPRLIRNRILGGILAGEEIKEVIHCLTGINERSNDDQVITKKERAHEYQIFV